MRVPGGGAAVSRAGTEAMPHDLAAERALLGAVLVDERVLALVADQLEPTDFYLPQHATLWRTLRAMAQRGSPIDIVTVGGELHRSGAQWLGWADLPEQCPSSAGAATYAARVAETAAQRRLLAALHEAERQVRAGTEGGAVFETLLAATAVRKRTDTWNAEDAWLENEREADEILLGLREQASERVMGTGYPELDRMLRGGFRGGDLVIVGGSPSMGKSSLAMGFMAHAMQVGMRALYLSCEPRKPEWTQRLMSAVTTIPLALCSPSAARLRTQTQWDLSVRYATDFAAGLRGLTLSYRPALSLAQAVTYAKREALRGRLDIVVVDHLHLMNHGKANGERLDQAIARTTGGLKELAGELDCAVVALAQLNRSARSVEGNKGKGRTSDGDWWDAVALPTMSDLREAGAIEQDADVILFPVRASAAGPNGTALLSGPTGDTAAVVKVAKQRNGPTGRVGLTWDAECSSFRSRYVPMFNQQEGR